jgi:hypothetical protein
MSYTLAIRTVNDTADTLTLVEKSVWHYGNGGTWTDREEGHILQIGSSGTSGLLRFKSSNGEIFVVAVGVHNYKRWCDVQAKPKDDDTLPKLHPLYYNEKDPQYQVLWKQAPEASATTAKGKKITVKFYVADGNQLKATLTYE